MSALLAVEDIHTYYEESHILQGVSLEVPEGSVVSVLGRNGAGKTTTLRSVMGINPPRRGQVLFEGSSLDGLAPYRVAKQGIAYVPETRDVFPSLSVHENLTLGARAGSGGESWTLDRIFEIFPRLEERRDGSGGALSGGEQQMLSIARALMTNPRLLILDEPTEGLAPMVVQEIETILEKLKADGMTILLVEQNLAFATAFSDLNVILGKGRVRWRGTTPELEAAQEIKHTWLGV
jgi:branched-chain amino acid transport system ATP-binding protein